MKWGSIIPLIGGFTVAGLKATGKPPEVILSYPAFASNDSHCLQYFNMEMTDVTQTIYDEKLDFVVAVPPCSALSALNCKSCADYESVNWLYDTTKYVLGNIKPTVLIGENAPGLFQPKGKKVAENLKALAKEYGYAYSMYFTTTSLHGVPQHRQRTFYFFTKGKYAPIHKAINKPFTPLEEYLKIIPKDATYQDIQVQKDDLKSDPLWQFIVNELGSDYRQKMDALKLRTVLTYCRRNDGAFDRLLKFTKDLPQEYIEKILYVKNKTEGGGNIWDASPNIFINSINALVGRLFVSAVHPIEDRYYNVREYMHLMGLPHDFQLANNKYSQICQNVPVYTAKDMVREAMRIIEGDCTFSNSDEFYFNNLKQIEKIDNEVPINLFF